MRAPVLALVLSVLVVFALPQILPTAQAGTISANYLPLMGGDIHFTTNLPGHVGAKTSRGGILFGFRDDLPAGFGVDNKVPSFFQASCVEIGEAIQLPANNDHLSVSNLLGSSTVLGGISGPVFFDATRTARAEKLWGTFLALATNATTARAFQLALWEIAFDTDLTLASPNSPFFVDVGQFQAGITDLAETWLAAILADEGQNQMARTRLLLLSSPGVQDLVTPIPEPASLALLVFVGMLMWPRRRRG